MSASSLHNLLARLRSLDVKIWLEGERLRYSAPVGVMGAELREQLAGRKAEIIEFLRGAAQIARPSPPPVVAVDRQGPLPVSFAQRRMWFMDQLNKGNITFNNPRAFRLAGPLDANALQDALNLMIRRHETLRTVYRTVEGEPVQVILPHAEVVMRRVSVESLNEMERSSGAIDLLKRLREEPFDLENDVVVRAVLIKLDSRDHILGLVMHHIVSDNWAEWAFFQELGAAYDSISVGLEPHLPALPVQYADFAVWQRQYMQGEALDEHLSYWTTKLRDLPAVLTLPTDRPRPAVQTYRGATQPFSFSPELSTAIREASRRHGVTVFMLLLAVYKVMLCRYTNEEDIVVGSPIANRNSKETENLVGIFINTLVLRTDCSDNPPFEELLRRVRETALEAYAHQDLPFEMLVEKLQPERSLSYHPLFQVMFVHHNTPAVKLSLRGIETAELQVKHSNAKFDLCLSIRDEGESLDGWVEYSVDLFDAPTIERLVGHFQTLLKGFLARPERRLWDFEMITAAEREELLALAG
ncbi:MAG: condensation domain-containing protein [Pyrinomonadaceae bacterium]